MTLVKMKFCGGCEKNRLLTDFQKNASKPDGLQTQCRECFKKLNKKYLDEHPTFSRDKARRYRLQDPSKVNDRMYQYRIRHPERHREAVKRSQRKLRYGITQDQYEKMVAKQNGLCAACGRPDPRHKNLCIDHDHRNGKIRGLLCHGCNRALGMIEDSRDRLFGLIRYLDANYRKEEKVPIN